jgi:hypothetical protein
MHPLTLRTFLRQHFNYGRRAFRLHRDAVLQDDSQLRQSLAFHVSVPRLVTHVVPNGPRRAQEIAATVSGLVLWQAANAAGVAWEAVRSAVGATEAPDGDARRGRGGGGNAGQMVEDVQADTHGRSTKPLAPK